MVGVLGLWPLETVFQSILGHLPEREKIVKENSSLYHIRRRYTMKLLYTKIPQTCWKQNLYSAPDKNGL